MGGKNQIRFNAHEDRSSRDRARIRLPDGMELLPQLAKEAGCFTLNLGKQIQTVFTKSIAPCCSHSIAILETIVIHLR